MKTVLLQSVRVHARRYVASFLAIAIATSFIVVTGAIAASARSGMLGSISKPYDHADFVATDITPAQVSEFLSRDPEAGVVASTVQPASRNGVELVPEARIGAIADGPARWQTLVSGRFPTHPGDLVVESWAADAVGVKVGDRLTIGSNLETTVTGIVDSPSMDASASAYVSWPDLATFGTDVRVDALAWSGTVDPPATVQPAAEFIDYLQVRANNGVDVMATVLLLFAAIALFVSALVIANTFSILFAARKRDFALLRCVGATRGQVLRSIRTESLILAVAASAVGIGIGVGAGHGVVAAVRAVSPTTPMGPANASAMWFVGAALSGVLVTLAAAWVPTRTAVRTGPLNALRPHEIVSPRASMVRVAVGSVFVMAGVAGLAIAVALTAQSVMIVAGGTTFVGVLMLGPILVPALIRAVSVGRGATRQLATDNAIRNPRRTAATASALIVGVTLTSAVLTGLASGRSAIMAEMDAQHPIDVVLTSTTALTQLDAVRNTPGVESAVSIPGVVANVGTTEMPVLAATPGVAPADGTIRLPYGIAADGSMVTVRGVTLRVETGEGWGQAGLVSPVTLAELTNSPESLAIWVDAVDDADPDALGADLRAITHADLDNGLDARAYVDLQLDVLTGAVLGLLGIAIVIALFGIANTLGLSVLERARENSLLRALGITRGQLRRMLAMEAMLVTVAATTIGIIVGVTFAWVGVEVLIRPVAAGAPTLIPFGQLGCVVVVAALAGLAAGVLPGRRAGRILPAQGLALE